MSKIHLRGYVEKAEDNGILNVAVATDATIDRDGEVVDAAGVDLTNFEKNPVLLYAHDYRSDPIGKVISIKRDGSRILFTPQFAINISERAKQYFQMYKEGFLNAFSIGFIPKEWNDRQNADGSMTRIFTKTELLEISAVPVPANPSALVLAREYVKSAKMPEDIIHDMEEEANEKTVIGYKDRGIVDDVTTSWSGPSEVREAGDDLTKLKAMSTWYDSEKADTKSSYKLPHHRASDLKAVWRGVSAAMASLLGARGGVDIPEADRKGVYNHLSKHYEQFGKTAPDFKLVEAQVLKDIDLEYDAPIVVEIIQGDSEQLKTIKGDVDQIKDVLANKGKEGQSETIDGVFKHPQFHVAVLKAVDKALGLSLRDMKSKK